MGKIIRIGIKYIFKRKAKGMERKFAELVELSKLNELIKKDEKEEKCGKIWKIIGICAAVVVALGGIGFLIYKLIGNQTDDYDLYDDLDNYYVDDDVEKDPLTDQISDDISEADFAE